MATSAAERRDARRARSARRRSRSYSRRDLIGHFIERRQQTQRPCTHACCRGYRVHPENYPVILPSRTLRRASDRDLQAHFVKLSGEDTDRARRGEARILHEMARRDAESERRVEQARQREERTYRRREAIAANRAAARQEQEAEAERIRLDAERATQGYLVNPQGRARGITDAEILTGREDVFRRYATDEARDYFAAHPRPTAAYLRRGADTRVHERATEPRRRRRGVVAR